MFKGLEHPSGFPSMLRGSTPEPRPLVRKESYGSSNQLRRTDSFNNSATPPSQLQRKDSLTSSATNRDSHGSTPLSRKDSNASSLGCRDSGELRNSKRDSLSDDFRRLSFGNSIYLRPDSSGAVNLIRRDSIGRKDPSVSHHHARDFVGKLFEPSANYAVERTDKDLNSILRKTDTDVQKRKDSDGNDLTTANLSKHVTILERNDGSPDRSKVESYLTARRDSSGSISNYLASRRISVDSLDLRRNSRRGSSASADVNINALSDIQKDDEVNCFNTRYTVRIFNE